MDGIHKWNDPSRHLMVLAVTNNIDSLDEAVLRPGRFEQHVSVPAPSADGRAQILKRKLSRMPVESEVVSDFYLLELSKNTEGCTGNHNRTRIYFYLLFYKELTWNSYVMRQRCLAFEKTSIISRYTWSERHRDQTSDGWILNRFRLGTSKWL